VPISNLISTTEELLNTFGGHPMAAGLNLPLENVSQFRRSLADNYHKLVGESPQAIKIHIDSEITFCDIDEDMIRDFNRLAPFGAGNPKLTFATRGVHTTDSNIKPIGRTGNHRKITFTDANGDQADLLWWNSSNIPIPDMPLDIAYSLEISTYRNKPQIQSTLLHLRHSPESPVHIPESNQLQLIDLRSSSDPINEITKLANQPRTIIWAENIDPLGLPTVPRSKIENCDVFIIWSSPPSKYVLRQALLSATPSKVILVGASPNITNLKSFINALLGLIKHIKSTGKPINQSRFSEILAVPQEIVELGIEWLHNQGAYDLSKINEGIILDGTHDPLPNFKSVDNMLKQMLREMLSYRTYFRNAHIRAIL
jgi:single-stranded-DNA-specific exonuclease